MCPGRKTHVAAPDAIGSDASDDPANGNNHDSEHRSDSCSDSESAEQECSDADSSVSEYQDGYMALVSENASKSTWTLVCDIAETQDKKLQAAYYSSPSNRGNSAIVTGVARSLATWVFHPRLVDKEDGKEFHGTVSNISLYPQHEAIYWVSSTEDCIILEGFGLTEDGCLPVNVIARLKRELRDRKK